MTRPEPEPIGAIVLAGGRGSRMGEGPAKPLRILAGKPMIAHVVDRLGDLVAPLVVSTSDPKAYEFLGHPTVADLRPGFAGPLAGVEAGLVWHASRPQPVDRIFVVAADMPFLSADLASCLAAAGEGDQIVVAASPDGRLQPTVALWPASRLPHLSEWLDRYQNAAIRAFFDSVPTTVRRFAPDPAEPAFDPFANVNTPDELAAAEKRLSVRRS